MAEHTAALVLAYLLGSISPSFLLVKRVAGEDLRARGSGNLGGRNVWRVLGLLGVIAGHNYSVLLGFAGGKGMAAGAGGLLVLSPPSLGVVLLVGLAALAITGVIASRHAGNLRDYIRRERRTR